MKEVMATVLVSIIATVLLLLSLFGVVTLVGSSNVEASNTPANYERRVLRALETIADEQEKQSRHMKQCVCK